MEVIIVWHEKQIRNFLSNTLLTKILADHILNLVLHHDLPTIT